METLTALERQIENKRSAVEASPQDVDALLAYAEACLRRDLRLEALQAFQRLLTLQDSPEGHLALARLFARQQHFAESYDELRRVFDLDPQDLGGHLLLSWLHRYEPVPEDLSAHLEFIPGREQAAAARARLEEERDQLASEVDQYRALTAGADPEPILLYHLEESRKRVERVIDELERVEWWERIAQEEPVLQGVPRAALVAPEPVEQVVEDEAEPAPAPAPASSGEAVEEVPEEGPAPAPGPSEERRAFYASVADRLGDALGRVGQTRGVTSSMIVALDPWLVHQVGEDGDPGEALPEIALGVQALLEYRDGFSYWVLECEGGIVVLQRLDAAHLLLVSGKSGANFGSLRYAMDKLRPELAEILSGAPAA